MNNLCHRDLKPQNIFITEDRTLKIGDFGTCKSYSREKGKSLNTVVGTIPYMSFEIIKNYRGEKLKNNPIRDDIFALGLIFMEIATSNFYRRFNEIDNDTAVNTINNAFSKLNYPSDFIDLVKKMLCSPIDDYIEINEVIEILINLTPKTLEYNYFTEISYLTTQEKIINWFDYKESDTLTTRDCQSTELLIKRKEKEKKRRKIRKGFSIITFSFVMIFPTKRCQICKIIINNDRLELDCKHSYHSQCIVLLYQQALEQTTCKIERFRCENKSCRSFIKFEKFQEIGTLSQKAKIKASLLYWAYTPYFCFVCSFETDFFYLNDKLKDKTIVCPRCKKKFCSFCSGEGSHVLTCKAFDNLRNGRSCFDRLA
jgi:serine/threonine protein kinase